MRFLVLALIGVVAHPGLLLADALSEEDEPVDLRDYAPCGLTSFFAVCQLHQLDASWDQVKELVGSPDTDGTHSFEALSRAARNLGFYPVGVRVERSNLSDLPMPAIAQVHDPKRPDRTPHLLVVLKSSADGAYLLDAPYPPYFIPWSKLDEAWTGNVLVLTRDPDEAERVQRSVRSQRPRAAFAWAWLVFGCAGGLILVRRRVARSGRFALTWLAGRKILVARCVCGVALVLGMIGVTSGLPGRWLARFETARLAIDQPEMSLGELPPGEHVVRATIRNTGGSDLVMRAARSTCTCVIATAPPASLAPGESAEIQLKLNVVPGPRKAVITLASNDPTGDRHLVITWHGTVSPTLVPWRVYSDSERSDRPYERTVRIVYPDGPNAIRPELERWECSVSGITVRVESNDPEAMTVASANRLAGVQGELALRVTIPPPEQPGVIETSGQLHLSYGEVKSSLPLYFCVRFVGPLAPEPSAAVFSALSPSQLVGDERTVRLVGADGTCVIEPGTLLPT